MDRSELALLLIAIAGGAIALLPVLRHVWRERRRKQWFLRPFPAEWHDLLRTKWRLYDRLPPDLRHSLQGCTQVLLDEKRFEPCGGLPAITTEMRLLIAAQAALLLAGRPTAHHRFYPALVSILVYPGSFKDRGRRTFSLHEEAGATRLGESWASGSVILSWHSVKRGASGDHDGLNVVFHEFAHQIDQTAGDPNGVPAFADPKDADRWSEVLGQHFEDLQYDIEQGRAPLVDEYGASDPAEFFAVSTESFFERPRDLARDAPDLYAEMAAFYGLDPVTWRKC